VNKAKQVDDKAVVDFFKKENDVTIFRENK